MTDQENGTPVGEVTEEQAPEPAAAPETGGGGGGGKPYSDDDKIHLFLAYFGIFALIPFFMFRDKRSDPQKEYVYWHGRQGLALAVAFFVLWFVLFVVTLVLSMTGIGALLGCVIWPLYLLAALGAMVMGWVKAFGGEKWEIPGVAKLAEMFK